MLCRHWEQEAICPSDDQVNGHKTSRNLSHALKHWTPTDFTSNFTSSSITLELKAFKLILKGKNSALENEAAQVLVNAFALLHH